LRNRNVDATAKDEIERIVVRRSHYNAAGAILFQIPVHVRVGSTEHSLDKGLDVRSTEFKDRPYIVSKQVALYRAGTSTFSRTEGGIREVEVSGLASVPFEFGFDPDHAGEEIRKSSSAAVQREAVDDAAVLRVKTHVRIIHGDFCVLSECDTSKQKSKSYEK
jgi:hypothetical protein